MVKSAIPLNGEVFELLGNANDSIIRTKIDDFLHQLELLAMHWNLINNNKYKYRQKFYGTHDSAIS